MLRKQLPGINGLVTFEAAARHLSFTLAANELCVSQAAVSRQVKRLEEQLGCPVFHRAQRRIELTKDGHKLFQAVTMGLGHIASVSNDIRRTQATGQITIASTLAFSSFWLMPRIRAFQQQYPDIKVHVIATDKAQELRSDKVDLALTCGNNQLQGNQTHYLFSEQAYPVCSPEYLGTRQRPMQASDLMKHRLLHLDEQLWDNIGWDAIDWPAWLARFNVDSIDLDEDIKVPAGMTFNNYPMLIQAVLEGEGIALGFEHSTGDLVAQGKLVKLTDKVWDTGRGYYLAIKSNLVHHPDVQALSQWLLNSF
ncbi:MAG TPA: LysR family transcriptional regulator [Oceanospirillaceae bacterium]|nr:LysR family transcriptional regulator [Oceanospirillaceae bacterium]